MEIILTQDQLIHQRFKEVIDLLKQNNHSQKDIASRMGENNTYLNRLLNKKDKVTFDYLEKFFTAYPDVNPRYIKYGEGPIFLSDKSEKDDNSNILNEPPPTFYQTKLDKGSNVQHAPAYHPLKVYNLDEQTDNRLTPASVALSFPGSQNCDFAVFVHGEAMRGAVCNGGAVAVKEVKNKDIIPFGHMYFIELDDYELVRYIRKSDKEGHITLRAHNYQEYEDFDIPRKAINKLYKVRKILNDES